MSKTENRNFETDFVVINPNEQKEVNKPPSTAEIRRAALDNAVAAYDPANKMYSAYLGESGRANTLTQEVIERLGEGAQDDLDKIREINNIIRKYINIDDLLGMVYQSIWNNVNTEIKLSYKNFGEQKNKLKTLNKVKALINDFNMQINIKKFIRDAITITYAEGNYLCLLRNDKENWSVSKLSLGIAQNSGYTEQDNPVLLVDIKALNDVLRENTPLKNKKNQPLFFKDYEDEIKATYNDDVAKAYKDKESWVRLNTDYTGMIRINNMGRKYGLSPMFRALFPILMLSNFKKADEATAQARAKKIIHQVMRKELIQNNDADGNFEEQSFNHENFLRAFRQSTVVITTTPSVEKIVYVEPKVDDVNVDKINLYRYEILSSQGVAFLTNDKSQSAITATISLAQLLQHINTISEQVEKVVENFYGTLLTINNIGLEYMPSVSIIDSELLDTKLRIELSKMLFTIFGASRETAFGMLGIDLEDEIVKKERENEMNLDSVFMPPKTAFNTPGNNDNEGGREPDADSSNPDKQIEDELYNKNARQ